MEMVQDSQGSLETSLEGRWVELLRNVTSGQNAKELPFSSSLLNDIHEGFVAVGLRPRCSLLNALLDSMSFQLACIEKQALGRSVEEKAPSQDKSTEPDDGNFRDDATFLDDSPITLDATPPPPPTRLTVRKQAVNYSLGATDTVGTKPSTSSFAITAKKKNVWVDHDLQDQPASASTSTISNKRPSSQIKSKQYKQQSLFAMARNMPKTKVDVSTLKEFNGGSRTQSQTSMFDDGIASGSGVKRKSAESIESTDAAKRDKSYYFETSFEISPIKLPPPRPMSPSSPVPGPSKTLATASSPKKPLSPVNPRVSNRINNVRADNGPKPGGSKSKEEFNSTYDLLKDFDKIPSRKSPTSKFKYKQPTVRKKAERAKLPGWDCDECKGYYGLLESQMDEREIARIRDKCSRHRSKAPVVSNTPENFWCTQIPSTEELYRDGYIREGTPFTPPPRRKRRSSDLSDDEEEGSVYWDAL